MVLQNFSVTSHNFNLCNIARLFLCALLFASCSTKEEDFLAELEKFKSKVIINTDDYTYDKWMKLEGEFNEIIDDIALSDYDFSEEETELINSDFSKIKNGINRGKCKSFLVKLDEFKNRVVNNSDHFTNEKWMELEKEYAFFVKEVRTLDYDFSSEDKACIKRTFSEIENKVRRGKLKTKISEGFNAAVESVKNFFEDTISR